MILAIVMQGCITVAYISGGGAVDSRRHIV